MIVFYFSQRLKIGPEKTPHHQTKDNSNQNPLNFRGSLSATDISHIFIASKYTCFHPSQTCIFFTWPKKASSWHVTIFFYPIYPSNCHCETHHFGWQLTYRYSFATNLLSLLSCCTTLGSEACNTEWIHLWASFRSQLCSKDNAGRP